ncbi:MAG: ABC transporter permease [Gemmatimonadetes bacterium]|nr:ABC transporter permease [Gemmatimonadota bacterium]
MRVLRWLLRLTPQPFRREFGTAALETCERRLADARAAGGVRPVWTWMREARGLLGLALAEHLRARAARRSGTLAGAGFAGGARAGGALRELRHGGRRLRMSPAFALTAFFTLAMAMGANATIFTLVQRVVRNPLPYADGDALVSLDHAAPGIGASRGVQISDGIYFLYRERARTLDGIALYWQFEMTVTGDGDPERVRISRATPSLAAVLGVEPALGRWFTEDEGAPGGRPVAVLSDRIWQQRYGRDPDVLGRSIVLDGVSLDVVGVMPPGFAFPDESIAVWRPAQFDPTRARAGGFNFAAIAHIRAGHTLEEVRDELNALIARLPEAYPGDALAPTIINDAKLTSAVIGLKEEMVGSIARTLWILFGAGLIVLIVACANVANLFLVRSDVKQREVAVRRALGAGRRGIVGYFMAESVLLSLPGGVAALALTHAGLRALVAFGPALPRLHEVRVDGTVVLFTVLGSLLSALVFGAIPLARGLGSVAALRDAGRGRTAARSQLRVRHALMGGQVALALVLLVASALMVRSWLSMRAVDPNFDASSALTFQIGLSSDYPDRASAIEAWRQLIDRLAAIPGVTGVTAITCLPLAPERYCYGDPIGVDGRPAEPGSIPPIVAFRSAAGDVFEVLGVPIVRGRGITPADIASNAPVAVVNEALVDAYFPGEDPIGKRITTDFSDPADDEWATIVGVVRSTPTVSLTEPRAVPKLYLPLRTVDDGPNLIAMSFVLRTGVPPLGLLPAARSAIAEVDPNLALARVGTLERVLERAGAPMAFTMALLVTAAAVALLLGVVGIYGVVSYAVSQRTREIGVRMALGAAPRSVARMVLVEGGLVVSGGLVVGLLVALTTSRVLDTLLFGVRARDPQVFAAMAFLLVAVALTACWVPARRASSLRPTDALRAE